MPFRLAWCLLVVGCSALPQSSSEARTAALLDVTAIERYWTIQDVLARGDKVEESAWNALFETPAYKWQANAEATQQRIRGRMELAFQPDRQPLETALAEAKGYDVIRWEHHVRIRDGRHALGGTLEALTESTLIDDAIEIARSFVPAGALSAQEVTMPVRLLFFAPDAIADGGAIYIDLLHAKDRGNGLVRLLAHEFHHELYDRLCPFASIDEDVELYWAFATLKKLHMEGLADRIDKLRAPLADIPGLSPSYVQQFNEHYLAAPTMFAQLDAALVGLMSAEDRAQASRAMWDLIHLSGHPEGFFMANTIAASQGADALLEDVGDPFAFLRRFQSVMPLFSDKGMDALVELEAELQLVRGSAPGQE